MSATCQQCAVHGKKSLAFEDIPRTCLDIGRRWRTCLDCLPPLCHWQVTTAQALQAQAVEHLQGVQADLASCKHSLATGT